LLELNTAILSAISRLFSPAVFRELAKRGQCAAFARLFHLAGIDRRPEQTVADGFDAAFAVLKRAGQRDAYVYRSAITHKVLMGKHSLNTACMLAEFRAGACKADLVILNGTATVYEIKSERDSLTRLANQVANYAKVFASVNVIASEPQIDAVIATVPETVGVMSLSVRHTIYTVRNAIDDSDRVCQDGPARADFMVSRDPQRSCAPTACRADAGRERGMCWSSAVNSQYDGDSDCGGTRVSESRVVSVRDSHLRFAPLSTSHHYIFRGDHVHVMYRAHGWSFVELTTSSHPQLTPVGSRGWMLDSSL